MFEMVSRMTVRKVGPRGWNQRLDVAQKDERYSSGHPLGPSSLDTVFSLFSITYLGETFKWNYAAGFAFICVGVFFVFHQW